MSDEVGRPERSAVKIAAVGDVHFGLDSEGTLRPHLEDLPEDVDAFLLAGDLTRHGLADEAAVLATELASLHLPVVAVLGNHDYHANEEKAIVDLMEQAGVQVLDGSSRIVELDGTTLGVAGVKGFGGGFPGACGSEFGELVMKNFIRYAVDCADRLQDALQGLIAEHRVALIHYAPVEETLKGERLEIYPFLGSYLLADAIDAAGADLVLHGHAHAGSEKGTTPHGVPVRNVALDLIRRPYKIFRLGAEEGVDA
jgi:Icc-related predicted phosphoesterase